MKILGLNAFHADSSACLLIDGQIVSATEEERFARVKHWAGIPLESIKFCLRSFDLGIQDIDAICVGRDPSVKKFKKLAFMIRNPRIAFKMAKTRLTNRNDLKSIEKVIRSEFGFCPEIVFIEHHRAHLASAFFSSPFNEAAVISIDGSGDFSTLMIAKGLGSNLQVFESQDFPVSIGLFYSAFTQFLGFQHYGEEYKVMGLSPYGDPKYLDDLRALIWTDNQNIIEWDKDFFDLSGGIINYVDNKPILSTIFNETLFETKFGRKRVKGAAITQRDKDLASSLQRRTEELIFEVVNRALSMTESSNLCIAGGVAQNSVANGKITMNTNAVNLYIPSAGHDAGISMGAAQYYYYNILKNKRQDALYNANLGISFSNEQIEKILTKAGITYTYLADADLFKYLAQEIANGKVVGYFDGKAEFGPRALGSRSILADPRNPNAQKLLNEKIKMRESFRPFAPSILEEFGDEYFENYQFTPFMERVLPIKKDKQNLIPAVTHVDGSGRLQSVREDLRPRYYRLISEFNKITGIPILINTSFNENEPVVNIPEEAIDTFLRTDLDVLVLGNYLLNK
jgi:carbamoyltransferase